MCSAGKWKHLGMISRGSGFTPFLNILKAQCEPCESKSVGMPESATKMLRRGISRPLSSRGTSFEDGEGPPHESAASKLKQVKCENLALGMVTSVIGKRMKVALEELIEEACRRGVKATLRFCLTSRSRWSRQNICRRKR